MCRPGVRRPVQGEPAAAGPPQEYFNADSSRGNSSWQSSAGQFVQDIRYEQGPPPSMSAPPPPPPPPPVPPPPLPPAGPPPPLAKPPSTAKAASSLPAPTSPLSPAPPSAAAAQGTATPAAKGTPNRRSPGVKGVNSMRRGTFFGMYTPEAAAALARRKQAFEQSRKDAKALRVAAQARAARAQQYPDAQEFDPAQHMFSAENVLAQVTAELGGQGAAEPVAPIVSPPSPTLKPLPRADGSKLPRLSSSSSLNGASPDRSLSPTRSPARYSTQKSRIPRLSTLPSAHKLFELQSSGSATPTESTDATSSSAPAEDADQSDASTSPDSSPKHAPLVSQLRVSIPTDGVLPSQPAQGSLHNFLDALEGLRSRDATLSPHLDAWYAAGGLSIPVANGDKTAMRNLSLPIHSGSESDSSSGPSDTETPVSRPVVQSLNHLHHTSDADDDDHDVTVVAHTAAPVSVPAPVPEIGAPAPELVAPAPAQASAPAKASAAHPQDEDGDEDDVADDDSDLPPGWEAVIVPSTGKVFFFNASTQQKQWERPKAPVVFNSPTSRSGGGWILVESKSYPGRYMYHNTLTNVKQWDPPAEWPALQSPGGVSVTSVASSTSQDDNDVLVDEVRGVWKRLVSASRGRYYYYNVVSGVTQWEAPAEWQVQDDDDDD